ncbi:DUF6879 family protein [Streptomyces sp. NPDC059909]|uniref:DUF6879 family protein n=1 Tax=Streptomyces sp. NPDC059909 TaxID=3346998 RepID=UPI00365CDF88
MPSLVPFAAASHFFDTFQHTAWRLESRRGYASDRETEEYAAFLRGEIITEDMTDPYYVARRRQADEGKRFERVRVVDNPPTEGQLYLLHRAQFNIAAGEDIRHLTRTEALQLDLPNADVWLFDSRTLVTMHFDGADEMLGVEITEEPVHVVRACQIRDAAWHYAAPHNEFKTRVLSHV